MNKGAHAAKAGSVVAFKREDREKPQKVCLCGRESKDRHPIPKDCHAVSPDAPVWKALLGKKAGDKVTVNAPNGTYTIEVIDVELVDPSLKVA